MEQIKQLEEKVETLTQNIETLKSIILVALNKIDDNNSSFNKRFDVINTKLATIATQLDDLKGGSEHTIGTLEYGFKDLKSEISKINEVTGYSDMIANSNPFKKDIPAN
ncbi:hypothetical protein [Sphingobacterium multivorum]|uniref:hypothetical protein n=1 Tax=Sphingobacterium multivorum TaxID=28454 RepID=UPI003DA5FB2C